MHLLRVCAWDCSMGHLDWLDAFYSSKFCDMQILNMSHAHVLTMSLNAQVIISSSSVTTTISHTFSEYNTAATIYVIGPMSLTCIFRVFRTIKADMISSVEKKMVLIILLMTQYSTMIVVRHDTIQGTWHYFFTSLTFLFLILYHNIIVACCSDQLTQVVVMIKKYISITSAILMISFGAVQMIISDIRDMRALWEFFCVVEVFAVLLLGSLDVVDVYVFGELIGIE